MAIDALFCLSVPELVFEVAGEAVGDVAPIIRERMSAAAEISVPLVVDVGEGDNWDEAH